MYKSTATEWQPTLPQLFKFTVLGSGTCSTGSRRAVHRRKRQLKHSGLEASGF